MVLAQAEWQPATGHTASRDVVRPGCHFQENIPQTSRLDRNSEWEPIPEEAAWKRQVPEMGREKTGNCSVFHDV